MKAFVKQIAFLPIFASLAMSNAVSAMTSEQEEDAEIQCIRMAEEKNLNDDAFDEFVDKCIAEKLQGK